MERLSGPFVAPGTSVKRSRSRVKDLQGLFSRAGGARSTLRGKSPFRPTISAPMAMSEGVAEEGVTKEDSSGEEEGRKDMTMSKARSMRQLFQGQKLTTKRMTSKERRGNAKSEPATPTGTLRDHSSECETRRPSHKLPALVRDHAVASINRRNKTTESGEHASNRLSLIGGVRKMSCSSQETSSGASTTSGYSTGRLRHSQAYSASPSTSPVHRRKASNGDVLDREPVVEMWRKLEDERKPPVPSRKSSIGNVLDEEPAFWRQEDIKKVRSRSIGDVLGGKEQEFWKKEEEEPMADTPRTPSTCPALEDDPVLYKKPDWEDRKTLPPPPPPPKPMRQESSRRGPVPGLVKLRQKIAHTTKLKPTEYVGFSKLPYQVYRKAVKKGFQFNLMLAGESGLGKASLINSMFLADICQRKKIHSGGVVQSQRVSLEEGDVRLDLNVLDLPGFGDDIDNSRCWAPIVQYVDAQFQLFLHSETRVNRIGQAQDDRRVHALLYFISPTGHGLRPLDIEVMLAMHNKVNIIPVIAKADTFTSEEREQFKEEVREQLQLNGIEVFKFRGNDLREDEDIAPPFAVVGSNVAITNSEGKVVRGREYPWGIVDIENKDHCDFTLVQNLLWGQNTQDLIESTHRVHYENYRCRRLLGDDEFLKAQTGGRDISKVSLLVREEEKAEHDKKLLRVEAEMTEVFKRKVDQKLEKLRQTELGLERRIERERAEVAAAREELQAKQDQFLKEKKIWERAKSASCGDLLRDGKGDLADREFPEVPKNWGFMTLRRNKKK